VYLVRALSGSEKNKEVKTKTKPNNSGAMKFTEKGIEINGKTAYMNKGELTDTLNNLLASDDLADLMKSELAAWEVLFQCDCCDEYYLHKERVAYYDRIVCM